MQPGNRIGLRHSALWCLTDRCEISCSVVTATLRNQTLMYTYKRSHSHNQSLSTAIIGHTKQS